MHACVKFKKKIRKIQSSSPSYYMFCLLWMDIIESEPAYIFQILPVVMLCSLNLLKLGQVFTEQEIL